MVDKVWDHMLSITLQPHLWTSLHGILHWQFIQQTRLWREPYFHRWHTKSMQLLPGKSYVDIHLLDYHFWRHCRTPLDALNTLNVNFSTSFAQHLRSTCNRNHCARSSLWCSHRHKSVFGKRLWWNIWSTAQSLVSLSKWRISTTTSHQTMSRFYLANGSRISKSRLATSTR